MENEVLSILEEICGTDEVREDMNVNLFDTGLLDSLGITELLIGIEEKLGIDIAPTEITREDINTPNKIIKFLAGRK